MINITTAILIIILLFLLGLLLRSFTSLQVCALCGAVSGTWLGLLGTRFAGMSVDPALLGLLIGGSIVGAMYAVEDRLPNAYSILKLPFYLSLLVLAYFVLVGTASYLSILLLALVWVITLFIFKTRRHVQIKKLAQKIINCCKNW